MFKSLLTFTVSSPKECSVIEGMLHTHSIVFHVLCQNNYFSYQFLDVDKPWVVQGGSSQGKLSPLTPSDFSICFQPLSCTPRSKAKGPSTPHQYPKAKDLRCSLCSQAMEYLTCLAPLVIWLSAPQGITEQEGRQEEEEVG